jgi:hypothetical protein
LEYDEDLKKEEEDKIKEERKRKAILRDKR